MICEFVPKVSVVFAVGGCFWVCFWVVKVVLDFVFVGLFLIWSGLWRMKNEGRKRKQGKRANSLELETFPLDLLQ